jgi:hypothetical protein
LLLKIYSVLVGFGLLPPFCGRWKCLKLNNYNIIIKNKKCLFEIRLRLCCDQSFCNLFWQKIFFNLKFSIEQFPQKIFFWKITRVPQLNAKNVEKKRTRFLNAKSVPFGNQKTLRRVFVSINILDAFLHFPRVFWFA